ncbi:Uncharacterised protein [Bordetella ansorpii]|uniref:DUF6900 domain-containing protein n=1 Tax=Bordetella ansorpii TaxID=288768 RepID=A0A157SSM3_9BORD|nr:hypothetical protein [Bordetella ansorpii]SAI73143.1 Uncharacterised protein [Bordetella ansorpii]
MAKPTLSQTAQEEIAGIADTVLGIHTLEAQYVDRLDFHDLSVWSIKAALEAAYLAGMVDHHRGDESGATDPGTSMDKTNEQQLLDYLRGYARSHPANLHQLREYMRWPAMARAERDRRASRLLDVLPDDLLHAIAEGELDVNVVARRLDG